MKRPFYVKDPILDIYERADTSGAKYWLGWEMARSGAEREKKEQEGAPGE
jgi:hypothetical protein